MRRLLLVIGLLVAVGCGKRHHYEKRDMRVYHLKDGRVCAHDSGAEVWYWLYMINGQGYYRSSDTAIVGVPSGTKWVEFEEEEEREVLPETEQIEAENPAGVEAEEVIFNEQGEAMTDTQVSEESGSSESSAESSSADSGASDAGGGDGGGGGSSD